MRLKHLMIANCSRVADIEIEVRENMVLIGPNGAGKSTVLLCLDMLLGMSDQQLREMLSGEFIREAARPMSIEAALAEIDDDDIAELCEAAVLSGENEPVGLSDGTVATVENTPATLFEMLARLQRDELAIGLDARLDGDTIRIERFLASRGARINIALLQGGIVGWTFLRAQASLIDIRQNLEPIVRDAISKMNDHDGKGADIEDGGNKTTARLAAGKEAGDSRKATGTEARIAASDEKGDAKTTFGTPAQDTAGTLASLLVKSEATDIIKQELATRLSQALPYTLKRDDLEFAPSNNPSISSTGGMQLNIRENGQMRPLSEHSDGMRALFSMAIYDQLNKATNILAIDEPEAHLHPSSQRSLAKTLKASGGQMILVTHSPTIAGSFEPDEIVVIRADGTAVQPKEHFLSKNAGMLARWWIGRQLEPLTAGAVIAVEGPSDRVIVDRVASVMGFDLDRHDVVLVETNGCGDMKVVESIFGAGGFGIPLFELIDEDAEDDLARRLSVDESQLETRNVYVSTRDLEDEYVRAIGAKKLWDALKAARTFHKKVLALCKVQSDGYPTEHDLAQFIREKSNRKIPAALVAADLIDASNAHKVQSVAKLLAAASS